MAALSSLVDAFTAGTINATLWNATTGGAATLDAVNDQVVVACPTVNGANNSFGSNLLWDARGSQIYAQIGAVPNGNGGTKTSFKLTLDASNSTSLRIESGVFKFTMQIAGVTTTTVLPTYDPHAHRWWRLRESGGTFFGETSPDGLNWTILTSAAYSWSAAALTFGFQTGALTTEVAGNSATIAHVNTPLGGPVNQNWPLLEYGWGARWAANGGDSPLDRYVDQTKLTRHSTSVSRGRQYELDQVQAGELSLDIANSAGTLDPTNSAGPYAGHIQPFQPYRVRAQWPPTRNLLNQVQATGGDQGGIPVGVINQGNSGPSTFCSTDSANFQTIASGSAWQGGTVIQALVPNGTPAMFGTNATGLICWTPQPAAEAGATYTMQIRVRNITAATSLLVTPFINSISVSGGTANLGTPVTLTGAATAWTTMTITATLGADVAYLTAGFGLTAPAAANVTVQIDGWQLEPGSTASAWTCPAPWTPLYAGFVERWPSQWTMSGTYGLVSPTAADAFSLLSQRTLSDPLTAEITSHAPRFLYTLNDPQGSQQASDAAGANPAAKVLVSKYGPGSVTFGNPITATDPVNGVFTGGADSVATFNNASPGTNLYAAATYISLASAGIIGPAGAFAASFTRVVAFRYTGPVPTTGYATIWSASPKTKTSQSLFGVVIANDQKPYIIIQGPTGAGFNINPPGGTVCDGNWHFVTLSFNAATLGVSVGLDGTTGGTLTLTAPMLPTDLGSDALGAWIESALGNAGSWNYKGDIAYAAEFPGVLSGTDLGNIYSAWKSSCAGEPTNARYSRILRYAGYIGPSSVQTGLTTSMGPAAISGQDALSALQGVVDTEGGEHFADRGGTVTFKSRGARYNATVPLYVFGENAAAGEWPYEDCQLDYDSTHLGNVVTVTQDSTGQAFSAQDQASITAYFPRTLARNVNSSSALECQDAANYLLSRYRQPATRVSSIRLHPSANPQMWPVCLALELGMRVRVVRRPPGTPAITVECFIEKIQWSLDDSGEATQTLQCSPADLTPYAIFAAWHTTLRTTVGSGVTSITVNASADTTNPLGQQLAPGQQLILGQNSANQETVTISAVGATSPGWTSAVITLTAATTKGHTAGDLINEPLPAGVTDPTTFDASATFDAVAFAY